MRDLEVIKFIETESRRVGARAWGRRNGESVFNGDRVSIFEDEKVLQMMVVIAAQQCECS